MKGKQKGRKERKEKKEGKERTERCIYIRANKT